MASNVAYDRKPVYLAPSSGSGTYARSTIKRVVQRPDPILMATAFEVDPLDPAVVALAHALVETMRASPACIGLAAPQVGEPVRLFCMDVTGHPKARSCSGLVVLANPRIMQRKGEVVLREGCMSVQHLTGNVARATDVVVVGVEPGTGRVRRIEANGMEARCLQHEIDHLDGYVFVDRVRDKSKDLFARKSYG